ncbi:DNA-protecting protein DprA [Candidatus Acetothermia bacterium]|nr:DNA-protecting protein DprA [Candidatus Acetothermia bacterium]
MHTLEDKRYWIALTLIPNLNPKKFHILLEHFSSPEEIWNAPLEILKGIPGFAESAETFCHHRSRAVIEQELESIAKLDLRVMTLADPEYPKPLRALADASPVLYLKGDYLEKDELAIAIVGTRRATSYGRSVAAQFAQELGKLGFTIVSGLALGIDTAAHQSAIESGVRTIAVIGSGFGNVYPQENRRLLEPIAKQGAVLSEFASNVNPGQWTFPQRNRIISGLSRGVIVIEAPEASGALITAKTALEQGREVFAVPGSIASEKNRGAHQLIKKSGAKLVDSIDDIIEEFADLQAALKGRQAQPAPIQMPVLSPHEERVYAHLEFEPLHFNDLVEKTGLATSEISEALLSLEMQALVREIEGKRYVKLP